MDFIDLPGSFGKFGGVKLPSWRPVAPPANRNAVDSLRRPKRRRLVLAARRVGTVQRGVRCGRGGEGETGDL